MPTPSGGLVRHAPGSSTHAVPGRPQGVLSGARTFPRTVTPFEHLNEYGFDNFFAMPILVGTVLAASLATFVFVKKKGWL